jgi:hypothetical protein
LLNVLVIRDFARRLLVAAPNIALSQDGFGIHVHVMAGSHAQCNASVDSGVKDLHRFHEVATVWESAGFRVT